MLVALLSSVLSAYFAFLLPSYATFKALSHRPLSENDLVRWSKYWAVIGIFIALTTLGEWLVSWFPFYWEIRSAFLLFLSSSQTEGSTYVFDAFLKPFFSQHEADFDAGITAIQQSALDFLQRRLVALWQIVWSLLNKAPVTPSSTSPGADKSSSAAPQFSLQTAAGLWNTYGSSVLSALQPKNAAHSAETTTSSSSSSVYSSSDSPALQQRVPQPGVPIGTPLRSPNSEIAPAFPEPYHV